MSKVGIVTVLYNSSSVLMEYFESLNHQTFKDFTLYIIDNDSSDDSLATAQMLAKTSIFPCVFFSEKENWGVAKGNNIGIKAALKDNCEYILLSNNDVVLKDRNALSVLVSTMDYRDIGILCPKIMYYDNPSLIWAAGGGFIKDFTTTNQFGQGAKDKGQFDEEKQIDYTPTCFAIIRNTVFEEIGLMDERFFVYYDDTDFMYRAMLSEIKIFYTPRTVILHNESSSSGKDSPFKAYYLNRNQLLFVRKHRASTTYFGVLMHQIAALIMKQLWTKPRPIWRAKLKGIISGVKESCFFLI